MSEYPGAKPETPGPTTARSSNPYDDEQKRYSTVIELLKISITLSAAILGGWALFADDTKLPRDWTRACILIAIVAAAVALVGSVLSLLGVNYLIIERASITKLTEEKVRDIANITKQVERGATGSFLIIGISLLSIAIYVVSRNILLNRTATNTESLHITLDASEVLRERINQLQRRTDNNLNELQGEIVDVMKRLPKTGQATEPLEHLEELNARLKNIEAQLSC